MLEEYDEVNSSKPQDKTMHDRLIRKTNNSGQCPWNHKSKSDCLHFGSSDAFHSASWRLVSVSYLKMSRFITIYNVMKEVFVLFDPPNNVC